MEELYYKQNLGRDIVNESIGKFFKGYSKQIHNVDWKLFITLTYKFPQIREDKGNGNVKKLLRQWRKYDKSIDGIWVNDLDKNLVGIHHHIIVKTELIKSVLESVTNKVWRNKGIIDVREYDKSYEYCYCNYMSKHIGKTNRNNYYFISNFK